MVLNKTIGKLMGGCIQIETCTFVTWQANYYAKIFLKKFRDDETIDLFFQSQLNM